MIEVEQFDWGLRVVDVAKNQVEIEIDEWEEGGRPSEIDRHVEERIAGYASEIRIPGQTVVIESSTRERLLHLPLDESTILSDGNHTIQIDDGIAIYIVANARISVSSCLTSGIVSLCLQDVAKITFGIRSHVRHPQRGIKIPKTIRGLASAISTFGDFHLTDSPDRSYPSMRGHPPVIEYSDGNDDYPEHTQQSIKPVNIKIPDSLNSLFVVTPLAYYLNASVEVTSSEVPRIQTKDFEFQFPKNSPAWTEASKLLKKVFYLDCLVRSSGPNGIKTKEVSILPQLDIVPSNVYELSIDRRFECFAEIPFKDSIGNLPKWPYSASLEPDYEYAIALPHIANNLAIVNPPEFNRVSARDFLMTSLDKFVRGKDSEGNRSNLIEPKISEGTIQGWFGKDVAINAFNGIANSLENQFEFNGYDGRYPVFVVLNDDRMESESNQSIIEYVERFTKAGAEVEVFRNISIRRFTQILERPSAFLHYMGHCEGNELLCEDGYFSATTLSKVGVQSFFLNACNSYQVGKSFINLGSVAGGVTVGDVLEKQANKIGTTFARLVSTGLTISQSLDLARSRSLMNHQYTIVGDGTFCISQGGNNTPEVIHIWEGSDGNFLIDEKSVSPIFHGSVFQSETASEPTLQGNSNPHLISEEKLHWLLDVSDAPFVFEEHLLWPDDVKQKII